MDLVKVGELGENILVTKRNIDDTVVGQCGERVEDSNFLATTGGTSCNVDTGKLAVESTLSPKATGGVPERLPLGREVTVTGGDTKDVGIVLLKSLWGGNRVARLGGSVDQGEKLGRESLGDLVKIGLTASRLNALDDFKTKSARVAVGGVVEDSDSRSHCWR